MDDFLITTLYEYNRISAEDYLLHSWGKKPEQKKAEKKYNHWYYEKFKDRWKTKYNKPNSSSIGSSIGSSNAGSKNSSKLNGPAYDYTTESSTSPHKDSSKSFATKMTAAINLGMNAIIGGGAIASGIKLTSAGILTANPILTAAGVGVAAYGAVRAISAGSKATKAIVSEIKNASYDRHREKEPIDPKSGFHKKDQNLSPEEDIKRCNPKNQNFDSGTKNNCMLCSVTYDLRRRGLDVEAKEADYGYNIKDIDRWYNGVEKYQIGNTKDGKTVSQEALVDNIESFKKMPGKNKSSGLIVVTWSKNGGSHAMHYEYRDGQIYISDPQTGKIYKNPKDVLKLTSGASIIRLDNKEVNWKAVKECCA